MISFRNGVLNINVDFKGISKLIYQICFVLYIVSTFAYADKGMVSPVMGCVLFAASMLVVISDGSRNVTVPIVTIWYAIVTVYCALSMIWAGSSDGLYLIIRMAVSCLVTTSIVLYVSDKKDFDRLTSAFILAIFIVTVLEYSAIPSGSLFDGEVGSYFSSENKNTVSFWVLSALILSIYKAYYGGSKICWLLAAYFVFFIVVSGSRNAILSFFIGFFMLIAFGYRKKYYPLRILLCVAAMVAVFIFVMTNENAYYTIGRRLESMIDQYMSDNAMYDYSMYLREHFMDVAKELFQESPFLGAGIGSFYDRLYSEIGTNATYAHNNYWQVLSEHGIVGFVLYYWMYAYCIIKSIKKYVSEKNDTAVISLAFFLLFLIIEYALVTIFSKQFQVVLALAFCATYIEPHDERQYRYLQK